MELQTWFKRASHSGWYLRLLNLGLHRKIPFNAPHSISIRKIEEKQLTLTLPYIRRNKNHVKGIHACALATLCEYAAGLSLARALPATEYRLIMKELNMVYHFQARKNVEVVYGTPDSEITRIVNELKTEDASFTSCIVDVYDTDREHICTATVQWQVKPWSKTKTPR